MKRSLFIQEKTASKQSSDAQTTSAKRSYSTPGFLLFLMAAGLTLGFAYRYGDTNLEQLPLHTSEENSSLVGTDIRFQLKDDSSYQTDITFGIIAPDGKASLHLRDVDLSLLIPMVPKSALGNAALVQWFLMEREFNRQRVIFSAGSKHLELPNSFASYSADQLSVGLTNNCLGAGYWELAVYADTPSGQKTIYQGYFDFPRGAYGQLVAQLNPTTYRQQARTMEAWPGFQFLDGMTFDLDALRQVAHETQIDAFDLADETIMVLGEQAKKSDLIVGEIAGTTWADLRRSELKFQSFVPPGRYQPDRLWG